MLVARCLLIALAFATGGALAAEPTPASYRYRIHHELFGEIGAHELRVRREGDAVIVEQSAALAVTLLGITMFRRVSRYREVWRDERLIAFDGRTEDNGEPFVVTARAAGEQLIIEGSAGRIEAPAATAPSQPSLAAAMPRRWFMDIRTGALLEAKTASAGRERIEQGGRPVLAEKFVISGELEQEVWYDETGIWAKWRLQRGGGAVTLTRED